MVPGKLLVETVGYEDLEYLTEGSGDISSKKYYIKGPFIEMNRRNRNGRIYESSIMIPEVERFVKEKVNTRMAAGSIDHPITDSSVKLSEASHLITELVQNGDVFIGKAEILDTFPHGRNAKVLIEAKMQLAVSSRGIGSISSEGVVGSNYKLLTVDIVNLPSAHTTYVESILESQDYIIQGDKLVAVSMENFKKDLSKNGTRNIENDLKKFLESLKRKL